MKRLLIVYHSLTGGTDGIKVLAKGTIEKALTVRVHAVSAAAKAKIEAAGGTVEVIG